MGLEARLNRELQRRRMMDDSHPDQLRQLGQLPPPSTPQYEAITDEAPAPTRVTIGALDLHVPKAKLQAYQHDALLPSLAITSQHALRCFVPEIQQTYPDTSVPSGCGDRLPTLRAYGYVCTIRAYFCRGRKPN